MPTLPAETYHRPRTLADALAALSTNAPHDFRILAGGTDIYPAHAGRPLPRHIIDVSAIAEMQAIVASDKTVRIGGGVSWTQIARAKLPPAFQALQQAARQIGSVQVQNRGTIAGNLCNASPAADGIPPLLILDAEVELASATGVRRMPLADFVTGYRSTALQKGEILSSVIVSAPPATDRSAFVKLGARKYLVISIVMAAAMIRKDAAGTIQLARVAVGSASATALRLPALEDALNGLKAGTSASSVIRPAHFRGLSPIDDVRATAGYRSDAALQLVTEAVETAMADQA